MEIYLKADYALLAVLHSVQADGARLTIYQIAKGDVIPQDFLAKILRELSTAGILKSFAGMKGVCQLSRRADQISMLEVIEAVDGPVTFNRFQRHEKRPDGTPSMSELSYPFFANLDRQLIAALKGMTFAEINSHRRGRRVRSTPNDV